VNEQSTTLDAESRTDPAGTAAARWVARYRAVRRETEHLCEPLACEDYIVQSMSDVSPTKWHLAHTSWFFETFILTPHAPGYAAYNPHFAYLFNSYYVALGDRHCRQNRGLLSRPTVAEVYDYRRHVDEAMARLLLSLGEHALAGLAPLLEIGLHHEQQHQELILTDIKHVFWVNPLRPAYRPRVAPDDGPTPAMRWVSVDGGMHRVGHDDDGSEFAFDNESPRHRVFLEPFRLGSRLVTNGEYAEFIADGGYRRGELWLSLGWATAQAEGWGAPLYWIWDGRWLNHTLSGLRPVNDAEPVCHVSYFEADAYARWAGARLATEQEWEVASAAVPVAGNLADAGVYHPTPAPAAAPEGLAQMFGDAWEWTGSGYLPYPGYRPPPGALGEYNGKFMCNQFVLRGGSCATPAGHVRRTYRNFFPPDARWQFTGVRLAREA
jgi:ergothioneine biosynthesis protein EgtB